MSPGQRRIKTNYGDFGRISSWGRTPEEGHKRPGLPEEGAQVQKFEFRVLSPKIGSVKSNEC
jgi:hypothetical protein